MARAVVVVLFALAIVVLHIHAYPTLSPLDELQHFDYLVKASNLDLVHEGDRVGQVALRTEACRRVDSPFAPPPCSTPVLDPSAFQEYGVNTASNQNPPFYVVSGLVARAMVAVGLVPDLLVGGRIAGALWLAAGLLAVGALARALGVPASSRTILLVAVATTPVVVHASSTVNPDATLLATGAIVTLATLQWERRRLPLVALLAIVTLAVVVEPTNILVGGMAALFVAVGGRTSSGAAPTARTGRAAVVAFAMLLAASGTIAASVIVRRATASDAVPIELPRNRDFRADSLAAADVADQLDALVTPIGRPYIPDFLDNGAVRAANILLGLVLIVAVSDTVLHGTDPRARRLAMATGTVLLAAGPAMATFNFVVSGEFYSLPERYGLPLLPALIAVTGGFVERRGPRLVVLGITAVGAAGLLLGLAGS